MPRILRKIILLSLLSLHSLAATAGNCDDSVDEVIKQLAFLFQAEDVESRVGFLQEGFFTSPARKLIVHRKTSSGEMFLVQTLEGLAIVKAVVAHQRWADLFRNELGLLSAFSKFDFAPRFYGLISTNNLNQLTGKIFEEGEFGLVMQYIPDGWETKYYSDSPPSFVKDLSSLSISLQLNRIKRILKRLSIVPFDLQFIITADSKVRMLDFAGYVHEKAPRGFNSQENRYDGDGNLHRPIGDRLDEIFDRELRQIVKEISNAKKG